MAKKLTAKAKLKKELVDAIRIYIRLRDNDQCQHCMNYVTGSNSHISHIIPKSQGNVLRYDELNLMVKCHHCHLGWWHKNPLEGAEWFSKKFPERHKYVEEHKNDYCKLTDGDLAEMISMYKGKTEYLKLEG